MIDVTKEFIEQARQEYLRRQVPTICPTRFAAPSQAARTYLREEVKASRR